MQRLSLSIIPAPVLFAFCALTVAAATQGEARGVEGIWEGTLSVGTAKLRLVVKVSSAEGGALTGKLDSPDQGATDLPISSITLTGDSFRFDMKLIGGEYEGVVNKDRTEITGVWTQSGQSLPLTLRRVDKVTRPARPQEPAKPYPYDEHEVAYENAAGRVKLAGTLTIPRGQGPFPAVLLITGSGVRRARRSNTARSRKRCHLERSTSSQTGH